MQYIRPLDFQAFHPTDSHSQFIADRASGLDSAICIVTRVPPAKGSPFGMHTHPGDQFYYLLQGEMRLKIGDRELSARPRDLVFIPAGVPHMNWNPGDIDELHFEWITPQPAPGTDLVTAVSDGIPHGDVEGLELVRPFTESAFAEGTPWSQVVLADRASGVNSLSMGVFRVQPGGRLPGLHVHHFDQIYYVVSGLMTVQIGLEEYEAGPNTLVILPAGMPHTNWNASPEIEYHLNLRIPEPEDPNTHNWDIPVTFG